MSASSPSGLSEQATAVAEIEAHQLPRRATRPAAPAPAPRARWPRRTRWTPRARRSAATASFERESPRRARPAPRRAPRRARALRRAPSASRAYTRRRRRAPSPSCAARGRIEAEIQQRCGQAAPGAAAEVERAELAAVASGARRAPRGCASRRPPRSARARRPAWPSNEASGPKEYTSSWTGGCGVMSRQADRRGTARILPNGWAQGRATTISAPGRQASNALRDAAALGARRYPRDAPPRGRASGTSSSGGMPKDSFGSGGGSFTAPPSTPCRRGRQTRAQDAAEAEVARGALDRLGLARRGAVAQAVARRAQVRAALDDHAREPVLRRGGAARAVLVLVLDR